MTEPRRQIPDMSDRASTRPPLYPAQDTTGASGTPDFSQVDHRQRAKEILSGELQTTSGRRSGVKPDHLGLAAAYLTPRIPQDALTNRVESLSVVERGREITPGRTTEQYGELLFDRSKIFHGVGVDTLRLISILDQGILSERAAQEQGLDLTRNYGGYNLDDTVSMTASPAEHDTFTSGAFGKYVREGIGLVVERSKSKTERQSDSSASGFSDEVYVVHKVPPQKIVGVTVPEEMLTKPISELPLGLSKMAYGYVDNRCRKMITDIEQRLGYVSDTSRLEELMRQEREIKTSHMEYREEGQALRRVFGDMENFLGAYLGQAYAHTMGKAGVTLGDVLSKFLPKGMQVYNSDGFPLYLNRVRD